jgi:hypothetical protein
MTEQTTKANPHPRVSDPFSTIEVALDDVFRLKTARSIAVHAVLLRIAGTVVLESYAMHVSSSDPIGAEIQVRPIRCRVVGAESGRVPLQLPTGDEVVAGSTDDLYAVRAGWSAFDPGGCNGGRDNDGAFMSSGRLAVSVSLLETSQ